jgi:dTDP-4-amino-4,6-dideoxy-D-galactose acyltransferase
MEADLCQYLPWDSEFFGIRIARLNCSRLTSAAAAAAEARCIAEKINCLYFLAVSDDPSTVSVAEDHGYRFMDVRVTLSAELTSALPPVAPSGPASVRLCRQDDIPALRALAGVSHRESRFYADPRFADAACDRLYETWIEKSCCGYADAVFVADLGGGAAGYATAHKGKPGEGSLGLIAVNPEAQGMGLGRKLTAAVLDWGREHGLSLIHVVTQGRNCRAQRMYGRCGFLPDTLQLWYHRWFADTKKRGGA